ncbi:MAG: flavin reductase family protein [Deltaproteobacteria bacterium]|nr:flavin reductase family protein [Deltaproteobacteria bacterium]
MDKKSIGPSTLLFPTPAVLVGSEVDGKANFMAVAWCGIAASTPPAISVAIRGQRHTLKGIAEHRSFSVNIASAQMAKKVDYCGMYSGSSRDKSKLFSTFRGKLGGAPLIDECPVNLECKVIHQLELGSHVLVVGEIVESYVSSDCWDAQKKKVIPEKIDPLIYTGASQVYQRLGEIVGKAFHEGKELSL